MVRHDAHLTDIVPHLAYHDLLVRNTWLKFTFRLSRQIRPQADSAMVSSCNGYSSFGSPISGLGDD